jgi:maltose O-acetyltransferase
MSVLSRLRSFKHKAKEFFSAFKVYFFNDWLTFFPFYSVRVFYLRNILDVKVGKFSFIHLGARFEGTITIGDHSVIGRGCILKGDVTIKNNVSITAQTYIFTASHMVNDPYFKVFSIAVTIEDYAWIGARAMIMPGITIGKGAILGAASIATKNIPDYEIFVGAPAKKVGERSHDLRYELNYFPFFQ